MEYSSHKQRHCGCQTIIDKFCTEVVRIIAFLANLLVLECAKSAGIHNCVDRLSLLQPPQPSKVRHFSDQIQRAENLPSSEAPKIHCEPF